MSTKVMHPPFLLQLPHGSIDGRISCHAIFPSFQICFVIAPIYLFALFIFYHLVEILSFIGSQIKEFSEKHLAVERFWWLRVGAHRLVNILYRPIERPGAKRSKFQVRT